MVVPRSAGASHAGGIKCQSYVPHGGKRAGGERAKILQISAKIRQHVN
jgi:hypothetical protein